MRLRIASSRFSLPSAEAEAEAGRSPRVCEVDKAEDISEASRKSCVRGTEVVRTSLAWVGLVGCLGSASVVLLVDGWGGTHARFVDGVDEGDESSC